MTTIYIDSKPVDISITCDNRGNVAFWDIGANPITSEDELLEWYAHDKCTPTVIDNY